MAKIMDEDAMEALITSRTAAGCKLFLDTGCTGTWSGDSAGSVSVNNSPHRSPGMSLPLSNSYSGLVSLSRSSTPCRGRKTLMDDADKCIYNSLGSTSSSVGKQTYSELGLLRGWKKRGVMWKTGPNPSWITPWKRRYFVLKGNFLYYFACQRDMTKAPVLGAIYLKHALIHKESVGLSKTVLKICPSVPRRAGYVDSNEESSNFYVKFKTSSGRNEWYEELQQVSFEYSFPVQQGPLINSAMEFTPVGWSAGKVH